MSDPAPPVPNFGDGLGDQPADSPTRHLPATELALLAGFGSRPDSGVDAAPHAGGDPGRHIASTSGLATGPTPGPPIGPTSGPPASPTSGLPASPTSGLAAGPTPGPESPPSTLRLAPDVPEPAPGHLLACSRCAAELAAMVQLREALAALPRVEVPPALAARLDAALAVERSATLPAGPARGRRRSVPAVAAAAAAVLVGTGLALTGGLSPGGAGPGSTADLAGLGGPTQIATSSTPVSSAAPTADRVTSAGPSASLLTQARALAAAVLGAPARSSDVALPTSTSPTRSGGSAPSPAPGTTRGSAPRSGAGSVPGSALSGAAAGSALTRCLAVLGVTAPEVLAVGSVTWAGRPMTVLLLQSAPGATAPTALPADPEEDAATPARTVSLRAVVPGCLHGSRDVRFRLDGLRVR